MKQKQVLETNETIHEAIKKLQSIEKEVSNIEDALIRFRFAQGVILKPFSDLTAEQRYGRNILQQISAKTGISTGILRSAENLAYTFEYSEQKLHATLLELHKNNRRPTLAVLLRKREPRQKSTLSEESLMLDKDSLLRTTERGAEALEIAKKEFGTDDGEVHGVELAFSEALQGSGLLLESGSILAPEKWKQYHNPKYEEFLISVPCCITGATPVTLLHWAFIENDRPASDLLSLPIDESLVADFYALGPLEFFKRHRLNPMWACLDLIQQFLAEVSAPF